MGALLKVSSVGRSRIFYKHASYTPSVWESAARLTETNHSSKCQISTTIKTSQIPDVPVRSCLSGGVEKLHKQTVTQEDTPRT